MLGINWRELRLPPPPGLFIFKKIVDKTPINLKGHLGGWWISSRTLRDHGEFKGLIPGEYGLFDSLAPFFLGAGCLHDNKEVEGLENVRKFVALVNAGAKGTILADHKSFADNFLLQVNLAVKGGFWDIATRRLLPVVGLMYASRYPIESIFMRATNYIVAVPPTMEVPDSSQKEARKIWEQLQEKYPYYLSRGHVGLIFAEGTRSRSAEIIEPPAGIAKVLRHEGSIYLPTAMEGTEDILPPADEKGTPLPNFTAKTKIIFGTPLTFEEVDQQAKGLQREFKVGYRRAFLDIIYREIALLHIRQGNPKYAGYYTKALEEVYERREDPITRKG